MRNLTNVIMIAGTVLVSAVAQAGEVPVNVDAGLVVGPNNSSGNSFGGFLLNGEGSFIYAAQNGGTFEERPVGATQEDTPQAYNPMLTGESTYTSWILHRENSWLAEHDPPDGSGFEDENGNFLWSFCRVYVSDSETTVTLNQLRYQRFSDIPAFESDGVYSYDGEGYEVSLERFVIGIHYGPNGQYDGSTGDSDDIAYTEGNGDTLVHEIWIIADAGTTTDVIATLQNMGLDPEKMSGQAQLDVVVDVLNGEAPFEIENEFFLVDDGDDEIASGGSTVSILPTDQCLGDLNDDDVVNVNDLLTMLALWGTDGNGDNGVFADIAPNGVVDVNDLLELLASWGECPETG